jgi:hypothetical protein
MIWCLLGCQSTIGSPFVKRARRRMCTRLHQLRRASAKQQTSVGQNRCEASGPRNPSGSGARELTNRPRRRRPTPRPRRALLAPNRPPDPRRRRDRPPRMGTAAHPSPIPDSPATAVERSGPRNPSGSGARELTNRPRRRRPSPVPPPARIWRLCRAFGTDGHVQRGRSRPESTALARRRCLSHTQQLP